MQYILSCSYGKDSLACIEAIKQLGLPLDRIVHDEIWATDTIPAETPPVVEFKNYADKIILQRYGIKVEHFYAKNPDGSKLTYEQMFKSLPRRIRYVDVDGIKADVENGKTVRAACKERGISYKTYYNRLNNPEYTAIVNDKLQGQILGWPIRSKAWCGMLKERVIHVNLGKDVMNYIGIATNEQERIDRHKIKQDVRMPLVEIGWDENYCMQWCKENGLLSPVYSQSFRSGCWFCHNQGVGQLRLLRRQYPELWDLMLQWDSISPTPFKQDGLTVKDYDFRFRMENAGLIKEDVAFPWSIIQGRLKDVVLKEIERYEQGTGQCD